jgi:hypothetical protein
MKKAYDLTPSELVNSPLAELARKAGYASLKSMLNDLNLWGGDLDLIANFLGEQVAE